MKSLVFNQLLQVISYTKFQKIVKKYDGDKYKKTFSTWQHLKVMLYFQLSGRTSLRDLVTSLKSKSENLYHIGIGTVSRNNLSHKNKRSNSNIFQELYSELLNTMLGKKMIQKRKKFKFKDELKSFDSSTISLCLEIYQWAKFRKTKAGIKMHTLLSNDYDVPEMITVTNAKVHDSKELWKIPIKVNTIYIFDRAYLCLKYLYSLTQNRSHFVIRMKSNTKYLTLKNFEVSDLNKSKGVIFDHKIKFTGSKKDDYPETLRHIRFKDATTGKIFNFITDRFDLSPFTISEIYKDRWKIELFFKKIKQNLRIKKFLGTSRNSVLIQIWIAMIALLLFEWAKYISKNTSMGLKEFLSHIHENLFTEKCLVGILNHEKNQKRQDMLDSTNQQLSFSLGH